MSSDLAISVRGVSKAYHIYERPQDRLKQMLWRGKRRFHDEFWALRDIDFEVRKGEAVGIVGRNGSGKSTLLQIICGTVTPTTGVVQKNGRISPLLELGSGFNPEFTGRENVFFNGSILGLSRSEMEDRFDRIAAFADIGAFIDSPVKHYSSGMHARLAFSVAIHVDPEILIVDEILAVGDAPFQRRCLARFYEIRDMGCTILFVSHDAYQVKTICSKAVYLKDGFQVMFGQSADVVDRYTVDSETSLPVAAALSKRESSGDPVIPEGGHVDGPQDVADEHLFRIVSVQATGGGGAFLNRVLKSGDQLRICFDYVAMVEDFPEEISFVFNLKRHDDLYVCGATTIMDRTGVLKAKRKGCVVLEFPRIDLLAGEYKVRLAINDSQGIGVYAELVDAVVFTVKDDFRSHGLLHMDRNWKFES